MSFCDIISFNLRLFLSASKKQQELYREICHLFHTNLAPYSLSVIPYSISISTHTLSSLGVVGLCDGPG